MRAETEGLGWDKETRGLRGVVEDKGTSSAEGVAEVRLVSPGSTHEEKK